jgi:hypothetical protein
MFYKKVRVSKWVGIINLTPDSFSDGGVNFEPNQAIKNAISLIENGADIHAVDNAGYTSLYNTLLNDSIDVFGVNISPVP